MLSKEITKELKKMLLYVFVMLVIMVIIFALSGYFNLQVILGALLGGTVAYLNFVFLAFAVEKSVRGNAKGTMASSYSLRLILIAGAVVFAIKSPYINYLAMIIPLVFPRIAIYISNIFKKKEK